MSSLNEPDELLQALTACKTVEEVQAVLKKYIKAEKAPLLYTRIIQITFKCKLCYTERRSLQKVEATKEVTSHYQEVSTCFSCKEKLAMLEVEELVEMLINSVRFTNARPEIVQAKRESYDYQEFRVARVEEGELAEKTDDDKTKKEE